MTKQIRLGMAMILACALTALNANDVPRTIALAPLSVGEIEVGMSDVASLMSDVVGSSIAVQRRQSAGVPKRETRTGPKSDWDPKRKE